MYKVVFRPAVRRELACLGRRMPPAEYEALEAAIDGLATNPRPVGCRKLESGPYWRIEVSGRHYRVIYQVDEDQESVIIVRVG